MNFEEKLTKYAELAVCVGVNLQKGQEVLLQSPCECAFFARKIAEAAFRRGAKDVIVHYNDEALQRIRLDNASLETLKNIPPWSADSVNYYADRNAVMISISASDPDLFEGADPQKMSERTRASRMATKPITEARMLGKVRWNILSVPTAGWAKKVFPGLSEKEATDRLWEAIFNCVRMENGDPAAAWKKHNEELHRRADYLNRMQFDSLHYQNALGTDVTVGLPENHIWSGGGDLDSNGVFFMPNLPTEEVFCLPHRERVDGVIKSTMPLNYGGNLIEELSITYKEGKMVDFSARTGYEALRSIFDTDEGALHLGEVALVPHDSRISKLKLLFYNTLFDENASCHFAIGSAYPSCLKDGEKMSPEERAKAGFNDSLTHVDFMVGSEDLCITGKTKKGKEITLFQNGNWAV